MSDKATADKIAQLNRHFGGNIDKDVLAAVLEVCAGDVKAAQAFLQAQDGGGYDPRQLAQNEGGIPKDYPGQQKKAGPFAAMKKPEERRLQEPGPEDLIRSLFIDENVPYQAHFDAQNKQNELYVSVLLLLINQGVEVSKASRPRILAAAWARKDRLLADYLLSKEDMFALPQLLGALTLLDAGRRVRAIEKKITRLEKQGTAKVKKMGQFRSNINDLNREAHIGSVSGALAKHLIKNWVAKIPRDKLEFYALNLPKQPWCELADILHINPKDFQCPWFLEHAFGKEAPEDSVIVACKAINPENVVSILRKTPVPYSFLRLNVKPLPEEAKPLIAQYSPLDTVIWYYEELACEEVNAVLMERLKKGQQPSFGYGKLMERLLYFKSIRAPFYQKLLPLAETQLSRMDLQLEPPVVVFGDASYSMDVAIRVATVIGSVVAALCGADLKFFNGESVNPPIIPRTAAQVIDVATGVKADGLTAPAAALWPYYEKKQIVKLFIVVTDEVENEKYKGHFFPGLFEKYYKEVFPAKIAFVSFLENPAEKGRMVTALENLGIVPIQFKLDGKRPDLTKLDALLGLLASESSFFSKQVGDFKRHCDKGGLQALLDHLNAPKREIPISSTTTTSSEDDIVEKEGLDDKLLKLDLQEKKPPVEEAKPLQIPKGLQIDPKVCIICEENQADTALLECGHLSFCSKCAGPLKECPMCRAAVVRTVRIYQH